MQNKLILCIIDGFGHAPKNHANIIEDTMPYWDHLFNAHPHTYLEASGKAVGLPDHQMGNSEVGHMTIGLGQPIKQDLLRITEELDNISHHPMLDSLTGTIHVMGLFSEGGVHSHLNHFEKILKLLKNKNVVLHIFTDGRDTYMHAFKNDKPKLEALLNDNVKLGTISGRYFSMDRDKNYERTQKAYDAIAYGKSDEALETNTSDEFIEPHAINNYQGIKKGDSVLMVNFRADRILQLLEMFSKNADIANIFTMTSLPRHIDRVESLFKRPVLPKGLGAILSEKNVKQLRIAETEKYAHVTYFFNGGIDEPYPYEDRVLIPSKKVATYDLLPEMSTYEITEALLNGMKKEYPFIVVNFASPDMVGHTGNKEALRKALKTVDECLKNVIEHLGDYIIILTSDHGNCEKIENENHTPHTSHTTNKVPLVIVGKEGIDLPKDGTLADIAPLCLRILDISN